MGHLLSSRPQWTWLWDQGHGSAGRRGSEATTRIHCAIAGFVEPHGKEVGGLQDLRVTPV